MKKIVFGLFVFGLFALSADAAQWKLKSSSNATGFTTSTWVSLDDGVTTTTTLTDQDECFVLASPTLFGGYGENATFYGKSLTLGSVANNQSSYFNQYYNAKVYGGKDNVVLNDGLILERGSWSTAYGNDTVAQEYPLYGTVTVNATADSPFLIYRDNASKSALNLMGEVKGAGWLSVKGSKAPLYTLSFRGGYANFSGGVNLLADNDSNVASISRLCLPAGSCSATVTAQAGCRIATAAVGDVVTLGMMVLDDGAVLEFQATGTGATAASRVLNSSKLIATSGFTAAGSVKVEVSYDDSANGKFDDAFDLLTVPAGVELNESAFVFVPTDATHAEASFSVRDDGATKTLVLTYVGTGATLLTQAEDGNNNKGIEGVKWSDGSVGTSPDYNYACLGYEIYISSAGDHLNAFKGNSLRIGDATSGTVGTLQEYGGSKGVLMEFPNDGLVLACGALSVRYAKDYFLAGKIKVTALPENPFSIHHGCTYAASNPAYVNGSLTLLGPLTGSGSLQIDNGMISRAWSTNFCVNVFGDGSDFTGTINLISHESEFDIDDGHHACFGRAGLGLTNGVLRGSVNVGSGSYLALPSCGEKTRIRNLTLQDAAELRASAKADLKDGEPIALAGAIEVTDNFVMEGRAALKVDVTTAGSVGGDFVLLTAPYESQLDPGLFNLQVNGDAFYTRSAELKVTEDPETWQKSLVLSIPQAKLVTWATGATDGSNNQIVNDTNKDSFNSSMTNALNWSDGEVPHENTHYLCQATKASQYLRTESNGLGLSGSFPGESLTLEGVGSRTMTFLPIHKDYTIKLLRLLNNVWLMPATAGVTLHGDVEAVSGTSYWQVYAGGWLKIDGQLSGPGAIVVNGNGAGSSNPGGDVEFAGDNSGYSGRLRVYTTTSSDAEAPSMMTDQWGRRYYERLLASNGSNLGGAMSPADPRGVIIEACTQFIPLQTMTVDVSSRGWQIVSCGRFNVTNADVTLTFKSPLALYGTLYKEGDGRLELGNDALTFGAAATETEPSADPSLNTFDLFRGSVKILKADCLNGASIVVENGATPAFVMPTGTDDTDLSTYGLRNTKTTTPFAVAGDGQKIIFTVEGNAPTAYPATVALCTVKADAADAVEDLLEVVSPRFGGRVAPATLVRGDEVDGQVTFSARIDAPRGLSIILK